MSDSGKYINTYIDSSVAMSHDFMVQIIQLKTELKLSNDLVQEKSQVIDALIKEKEDAASSLSQENERFRNEIRNESEKLRVAQEESDRSLANARHWEDQFNVMKNKVSHIDAMSAQLNSMKQELIKKNQEVEQLTKKLEDKDNPKKKINTKGKPKPAAPTIEETDDF